MHSRPSWDEVWSHVADAVAARSLCSRAQVGAVIVDPTNRIVAVGYNNPPAGFDHGGKSCVEWCPRAKPNVEWTSGPTLLPIDDLTFTSDGAFISKSSPFGGTIETHATDDDLIARGFTSREVLDPGYADCLALHAEANAISVCDRSQRVGGKLYVIGDVCYTCAKLIANSGLTDVHVTRDGVDRDYRDPGRSYEFMESCGVTVVVDER